ncbi:MAG TPA: SGNH/GDSL hydrolase family protein [Polyangiaceae bacterium]
MLLRNLRVPSRALVSFVVVACGRPPTAEAPAPHPGAGSKAVAGEAPAPNAASGAPRLAPAALRADGADADPAARAKAPAAPEPARTPQPPEGVTVLHIGDSFAGALGIDLNRRLKEAGVRGILRYETSSYIPTWASEPKLATYLATYDPDLVLITLGANELEVVDPSIRIRTIERLVRRFDGRPCVWVGVPLWKGARGVLLDVIREHCAPCVYLDSNRLFPDMPRARDGIHPSIPAREEWARRVLAWLSAHRAATEERVWAIEP